MHTKNVSDRKISSESAPISVSIVDSSQNRYPFEKCSSKERNYLEPRLAQMPQEYLQPHNDEWTTSIPLKCIQAAQKHFGGVYATCKGENTEPEATQYRPCMTENYTHLVYNAFHDVMDCFNLDPKDFYLQIMIESGFHVNAFNDKGMDSGIAQFTANGIKKVIAKNRIARTREALLNSSRPSCSRISSIIGVFDIASFSVETRCSMIHIPQNPYRSMLFNYIHTMLDQIELKQEVDRELSQFKFVRSALTERTKRQLVYLAYNRGMEGMKRLLIGYTDYKKKRGPAAVDEKDLDLNQNLAAAKKIMKLDPEKRQILQNAIQKATIKKLSFAEYAVIYNASYVADMVAHQDYVRQLLGDQCSRF